VVIEGGANGSAGEGLLALGGEERKEIERASARQATTSRETAAVLT
jgi:hypothetical protein